MATAFDWNHLKSFLAVAQHGSLSAAARADRGSQPTLGRHIAALEAELGVHLFERSGAGLVLTANGLDLLEHARRMAEAADRLALAATGRAEALAGTIRITASEMVAAFFLPGILTALHREEPDIDIELVATNRTEDLLRREADIAVRMYRPTQPDVYSRSVGSLPLGLFAARSYLDRRGTPSGPDDLAEHDFVGLDDSTLLIDGFAAAGHPVGRTFFSLRCDHQVTDWFMVVAGFGIGVAPVPLGAAEPRVAPVSMGIEMPTLPLWLTAHSELKTSRRVRRVYDFLAERLQRI